MPRRRPALRLVAMLGATLLAGAGLTATTAVVASEPASAVDATLDGALLCNQNTLYATNAAGRVIAVDISNSDSKGQTAEVATLGAEANNGLGISREGVKMFAAANGGTATLREYDPKTGQVSASIATDAVRSIIRGAVDPSTGLYYLGGNYGSAPDNNAWLGAYDPATKKYIGQVGQLSGLKDGNGDFAFSTRGLLFVVAADTVYRVNAETMPTTPGTAPIGTTAIATLPAGTTSPGIAFSSDGYLYVSNAVQTNNVWTTTIYQLDPTSGAEIRRFPINGDYRASDLATCNYADTLTGQASIDDRWNSGDQFGLAITGGGITPNAGTRGTTTGSANGVQSQKAGAVLSTPTKQYTVTQTAAGTTDPANYDTTWKAVNTTTNAVVAQGTGSTAALTFPAATSSDGTDVVVTFANRLKLTHAQTAADVYSTPVETALDVPAAGVLRNDQGTGLTVTGHTDPQHGTVTMSATDGSFRYVPAKGFSGTDQFTYTATDGGGRTSTSTVTVTVTPTTTDDAFSVHAGQTATADAAKGLLANDRGSQLTITGNTDPAHGTVTVRADGSYSYTPADGWSGKDSFTYTAKDGSGASSTATVTVTVLPTAGADDVTATAGSPTKGAAPGLLGNDLGSGLTVQGATQPAHGSVTVAKDGSYVYTPADGYSGPDSFDYTVVDPSGNTDTVTVTVQVAPLAKDDTVRVAAGSTYTADTRATGVLGNDLGTGLTVDSNTAPAHGTVSVDKASGTFTYTPADGFSGTDTFRYTAVDASGAPTTATVRITVAPTAADDAVSTTTGTPVSVAVQRNDRGTDLTTTIVRGPANGTAVVEQDGTVSYTPAAGTSGVDTFEYTVTDGDGVTSTPATVTVTVTPRTWADTVSTTAGTRLAIDPATLTANDRGTGLHVTDASGAQHGGVAYDPATDAVVYRPAPGFSGTDTFTYTVTDASGTTATGTVTVVVGPQAAADTAEATAGSTLTVGADRGVLANDDGTGLQATVDRAPANGTLDLATDGSYTYTPKDGYSGTDTFTYTATDRDGRTTTGAVTITVSPATKADAVTVAAGSSVTVTSRDLTAADLGTGLRVTDVRNGEHGTAKRNEDGTVTYTPAPGYSGKDTFTYTVTDAEGNTATGTVAVTITPVVAGGSTTVAADGTTTVPADQGVLAGAKGTDLTVTGNTDPEHGAVTVDEDGGYTYTPEPGYSGPDTFDTTITDGSGNTTTGTVTIVVAPKAVADAAETRASTPVDVAVTRNDSGTALTVQSVTQPEHGTATVTGAGTVTYTPAAGFSGTDRFSYTVTDPTGGTATAVVTVTVAPTAATDRMETGPGTALPIAGSTLTKNDDGTGLTVTGHGSAAHGTVSTGSTPGSLVYTPDRGFSGTDTFAYTVTDASGQTATSTVTVVVGIAAVDHWNTTATNGTLRVPASKGVLSGDAGSGLTASIETKPAHGRVTLADDGSYVYTPTANWSGRDQFTYGATDAEGNTAYALVIIDVTPTATDDRASTTAGEPVTVKSPGVLGNDRGTDLTVVAAGRAQHGTVTIAADGTFTYTPAKGFSGTDTVTYRAQDAAGQQTTATVTITVGIAAVDDAARTIAGAPVARDAAHGLLANDQGTGLTAALDRRPAHGAVRVQPNGAYVYTPADGFTGKDTFTYTVTDASGQTTTATATITVVAAAVAADDEVTGSAGKPVRVQPLDNDHGTGGAAFDTATLHLLDPRTGRPVDRVTVDGEGTWTVRDGSVVFTPAEGHTGTLFIGYTVTDTEGQSVQATITVTYPTGIAAVVHDAELAFTGTTGLVGLGLGALALVLAGVLLASRRRFTVEQAPGIRRSPRP
ncbi:MULTISPECIES: Ig-like domain-containing protein [unclassified Curtobacterium]|uniref:Ig-like domain-containing protein n=1 Tax=unclassified Curtobacterium TaxID=257496 RepID=UPI001586FA4A|nr:MULTISPECIES: Ig-like domain-containing protein [unclassified Curtobacterium]